MTENLDLDTPEMDQDAKDAAARAAEYEHGWSADIETEFAVTFLQSETQSAAGARGLRR